MTQTLLCGMRSVLQKLGVELEAAVKGWDSSKNDLAQLYKERDDLRQQVRRILLRLLLVRSPPAREAQLNSRGRET